MPVLVMKFGGTSVATLDRIRRAAKRVGLEVAKGYDVLATAKDSMYSLAQKECFKFSNKKFLVLFMVNPSENLHAST